MKRMDQEPYEKKKNGRIESKIFIKFQIDRIIFPFLQRFHEIDRILFPFFKKFREIPRNR